MAVEGQDWFVTFAQLIGSVDRSLDRTRHFITQSFCDIPGLQDAGL